MDINLNIINIAGMKKVLLLVALYFLTQTLISQTKWQINFYGNYSLPTADLEGTFPDTLGTAGKLDFSTAKTLLTKTGFGFGSQVKYCVDTTGNARLTAGLSYNMFSGSKEYPIVNKPTRTYKSKVNLFTISAGAEYSLNPEKKISPFFGIDLAANFFGGSIESKGDTTFTIDRSKETRIGIIANTGVNVMVSKNIGLMLGVKYSLTNLIGKSTEIVTRTTNTTTDEEETGSVVFFELPLNDAESGSNKSKTFSFFQFYAGVSINFGKPLK